MVDARKLRSKLDPAAAGCGVEPAECAPPLNTSDYPAWLDQPFAPPQEKDEIGFTGPGRLAG